MTHHKIHFSITSIDTFDFLISHSNGSFIVVYQTLNNGLYTTLMNKTNTTTILNERNNSLKRGRDISSVLSVSDNLFMVSKLLSARTQNQYDFSFLFDIDLP